MKDVKPQIEDESPLGEDEIAALPADPTEETEAIQSTKAIEYVDASLARSARQRRRWAKHRQKLLALLRPQIVDGLIRGHSINRIAGTVGLEKHTCSWYVHKVQEDIKDECTERLSYAVSTEDARLLEIERNLWEDYMTSKAKGESRYSERFLGRLIEASESRRRLHGLDRPTTVRHEHLTVHLIGTVIESVAIWAAPLNLPADQIEALSRLLEAKLNVNSKDLLGVDQSRSLPDLTAVRGFESKAEVVQ